LEYIKSGGKDREREMKETLVKYFFNNKLNMQRGQDGNAGDCAINVN